MPELPETETIARDLHREVRGARITAVHVTKADVLREVTPQQLGKRVTGAVITRGWRRAKLVVLDLSTGDHLVVQPRFTGALLIDAGDLSSREREYSTPELALHDGRSIHYRDILPATRHRRAHARRPIRALFLSTGVEPLDPAFTAEHLSGLLRGSRQAVKRS
jgi:formamidopyrimidine-DNA glycosylase